MKLILIKHRVNSISKLKSTPSKFGVEIDLRCNKDKIYLAHDAFKKGTLFSNWLKNYNHSFIVLNVKEEGLETKILKLLSKNKVKNYFFHDQTFSTLLKSIKKKIPASIRFSEYENIQDAHLVSKVNWVWVDHFTKFPLTKKKYNFFKKLNCKICIVSPELISLKNKKKIKNLKMKIAKKNFKIDAVCTKFPKLWSDEKNI